MVTYPNGQIPFDVMRPVPAANSQTAWLLPGPASSFLAVREECMGLHGWAPVVTSAGDGFRSYARQVTVFDERYDPEPNGSIRGPYGDIRYSSHQGGVRKRFVRMRGAAAAIPGTSNHGKGITVDIAYLRYNTPAWRNLSPILHRHGWSNVEGSRINEPWHWNYTRDVELVLDTNHIPDVQITLPDGVLPDLILKEIDRMDTIRVVLNGTQYLVNPSQGLFHGIQAIEQASALNTVYPDQKVYDVDLATFQHLRQLTAVAGERLHPGFRAEFRGESITYVPR